uniref:RNase H type-1 domain-containing protein n=1 Tax=Aegilops tauschii subsp. strangulata TaxID=200361 RepID=A0A453I2W9_AEGTS
MVLNVDASFSKDYSGSCGAVIRDHLSAFIGASTAKLEHVANTLSAQAAALVEGLKLALQLGINSLLV